MRESIDFYDSMLNIIIASALAAIIFSIFNLNKIFYIFIPALIFFLVNYFSKLIAAKIKGFDIKSRFLKIERYWFAEWGKFPVALPAWLIFPLLFSLLSYGVIKLFTFLGFEYKERIERVIRKREYREKDIAIISAIGLASCYLLTLIFHALGLYQYALIGIWFTLTNSLPFGSIDGGKIFIFSWIIWASIFIFLLISLFVLNLTNIWVSIILGIIFAIIVGFVGLRKLIR